LGIPSKVALIGVCEKGYADYILEAQSPGGHASVPKKRTALGLLSEAVYDVELNPRRSAWSKPAKDLLKALAPHVRNPLFKFLFVNRDILSPVLRRLLCWVNPMFNGLLRTTFAVTQMRGADAPNVLPSKATANINCRLNIDDNMQTVKAHIEKIVGKKIKVTIAEGSYNPSPVSDITSTAYQMLKSTISEAFGGFITAPYPFIAATDSQYYYKLTNNVYRFSPFEYTEEDSERIHAANERQDIDGLAAATRFFMRLYENA
jgi:carboxypeptidase PM20D1